MKIPTLGFWLFDELAPMIGWGMPHIDIQTPNYGRFYIKASSLRLECMVDNNRCVSCGREGILWQLQAHHYCRDNDGNIVLRETPHLNLYAIDDDDSLVLMTRDHIIPRSKGGKNILENLQTLCTICNAEKADKLSF